MANDRKRSLFAGIAVLAACAVLAGGCSRNSASGQTATAAPTPRVSQEVECDWTLAVNDTVKTKSNGYDLTCTLKIDAVKAGGISETGTYVGAASISYEYDMQRGDVAGNAAGAGQDANAKVAVTSYDAAAYSDAGPDNGALAPVVEYDAMALGSFAFTGTGLSQESAGGAQWSEEKGNTTQVPFRMAVDGGQVSVELPSIAPNVVFEGTITGTPK